MGVKHLHRLGRGDDAAPTLLAPVLPPLTVGDEGLGLLARKEPADRFRGAGEAGVLGVDEGARDDRGDGWPHGAAGQGGLEGVEQDEADGALGLGAAPVERHGWHDVGSELVLDEEVADLGSVAVGDDDLVAGADEVREVAARRRDGGMLGLGCRVAAGARHGVSAQRDEHPHAAAWVVMA